MAVLLVTEPLTLVHGPVLEDDFFSLFDVIKVEPLRSWYILRRAWAKVIDVELLESRVAEVELLLEARHSFAGQISSESTLDSDDRPKVVHISSLEKTYMSAKNLPT